MAREYTAKSIEVLSGLDPVKKRPGMYTETSRPNHLALEVIDNSIDEALGGFASKIDVVLLEDGSLSVEDDGRGMPVDIHPDEGIPAVELIFTRLHAGAKFSNEDYKFSGGLHGVGVSVVNALSSFLEAEIKRIEDNVDKMKQQFKKAGLLSFTVTQIWNKQGNNRLGIYYSYKDEKAFIACQKLLNGIPEDEDNP